MLQMSTLSLQKRRKKRCKTDFLFSDLKFETTTNQQAITTTFIGSDVSR